MDSRLITLIVFGLLFLLIGVLGPFWHINRVFSERGRWIWEYSFPKPDDPDWDRKAELATRYAKLLDVVDQDEMLRKFWIFPITRWRDIAEARVRSKKG